MADRIVRVPLWTNAAVASGGSITSPTIDLTRSDEGFESFVYQASSVSGTADVKIVYAVSADGTNFGSFDDNTDLVASSAAVPTAEGIKAVPGVIVAAPYIRIKVTGNGGNPADTLFTMVFYIRETPDGQTN